MCFESVRKDSPSVGGRCSGMVQQVALVLHRDSSQALFFNSPERKNVLAADFLLLFR